MIVEPLAADNLADNLNPVSRIHYGFSTFLCVPNATLQGASHPLGAQAGEAAIRQVVTQAGFRRFRRAAQTPFNAVYEARPERSLGQGSPYTSGWRDRGMRAASFLKASSR